MGKITCLVAAVLLVTCQPTVAQTVFICTPMTFITIDENETVSEKYSSFTMKVEAYAISAGLVQS